jgi:hypothetical protein
LQSALNEQAHIEFLIVQLRAIGKSTRFDAAQINQPVGR